MSEQGKCSGGRVEPSRFTEGWIMVPFVGGRTPVAHWWVKVEREADWPAIDDAKPYLGALHYLGSLCGVGAVTSDGAGLHLAGDFPYCKRCLRLAPAEGSA